MAISDTSGGVRHVRCPRCHSVLQEPTGVPVYQCGGCGASLRAKIRSADAQDASVGAAAPSSTESFSRSPRLTSPRLSLSSRLVTGDVASTSASASAPDAPTTTSQRETGDLTPERRDPTSSQAAPSVETKGRDHRSAADRSEADGSSGRRRGAVSAPNASANFSRGSRDAAAELEHSEGRRQAEPETDDAARKNGSELQYSERRRQGRQPEPVGATTKRGSDEASAGEGAVTSTRAAESWSAPASVSWKQQDGDHRSAADRSEADGSSGRHRGRGAVSAPNASANFSGESRDAAVEMQDSEGRRQAEPEPVSAATKRGSDEASAGEAAAVSARAADSRSAPAAVSWKRQDDVTAVAEEKAPSPPPRHELSPKMMSPLHEKILKTVDELKDDLSELFSKSPELKPSTPPRTPRHPTREGHASRPAIPTGRARHAAAAAALHRRGNAGYAADKHGQAAPRGLPSRKYRRCRADTCGGHDARPAGPCRRDSCCDHGKPGCGSCRGHCCGSSRAREPARPQAEAQRRAPPPKRHCRPVLKGAPFIVCSSCFTLVQVPAGFAVASARVRDLRCGACSAVLSYSYRDPDRKKPVDSSPARHVVGAGARPDLFSFIEDFAGGVSSYSTTEDERPLHVSRNSSFDTVVVAAAEEEALPQSTSLHRLMGYGSARELLLRRSPSLYEFGSFDDKRSTPPSDASSRRHVDRKGKAVCLDTDHGDDDSDDSAGALRRSKVRGAGWRHGRGIPTAGAIRIRS